MKKNMKNRYVFIKTRVRTSGTYIFLKQRKIEFIGLDKYTICIDLLTSSRCYADSLMVPLRK